MKYFAIKPIVIFLSMQMLSLENAFSLSSIERMRHVMEDKEYELLLNCNERLLTWTKLKNNEFYTDNDYLLFQYKVSGKLPVTFCNTTLSTNSCELPMFVYLGKVEYIVMTVSSDARVIGQNFQPFCHRSHGECFSAEKLYYSGFSPLNRIMFTTGARFNCKKRELTWIHRTIDLDKENLLYTVYYSDYNTDNLCVLEGCYRTTSRTCKIPKTYFFDDRFVVIVERNKKRSDLVHGPTILWGCDRDWI